MTSEKEILYLRYQRSRYQNFVIQESDQELLEGMRWNLFEYTENSLEMNLSLDGKILCFMILDFASDSLSAVYSVYDPDYPDRSLGSFAILSSILYAKELGMKYFHLGYFLPGHPNMDYKNIGSLHKFGNRFLMKIVGLKQKSFKKDILTFLGKNFLPLNHTCQFRLFP